jgi:protein KIBRA
VGLPVAASQFPIPFSSAASQTDLCSENFPIGAREMAKLRLNYDEWRKRVKEIQEKLAALEERVGS